MNGTKKYDLNKLAERLRDAYLDECVTGDCRCISKEGHERNLALARKQKEKNKK